MGTTARALVLDAGATAAKGQTRASQSRARRVSYTADSCRSFCGAKIFCKVPAADVSTCSKQRVQKLSLFDYHDGEAEQSRRHLDGRALEDVMCSRSPEISAENTWGSGLRAARFIDRPQCAGRYGRPSLRLPPPLQLDPSL